MTTNRAVRVRPGTYIRTIIQSPNITGDGQLGTPWIGAGPENDGYRKEVLRRLCREFSGKPVYRFRATTPPRPRHRWSSIGICGRCLAIKEQAPSAFCPTECRR